ncbi:MAG: helix-turn-helix transcriptional regulator [Oscillospiraceae bacterium]|nr:helix-turn-helix transcriptional regulator [Oscillospiraceae bacterium]
MPSESLARIGNRLLAIRKRRGLTQAEVAEASGLSDRTYADIERGCTNMRVETLLRICATLHITPNEALIDSEHTICDSQRIVEQFSNCTQKDKETALKLLSTYLNSLE